MLDGDCASRILGEASPPTAAGESMQTATRLVRPLAVVSLVALQLSCGGDSSGPGNVATTMSANSATSISSPPGSQVSERPSVVVYDQAGDPMSGVTVTFLPGGGGGMVTGERQVTNAQGVATVGGWTLGTTVGTYTLAASAGNLPQVTFTASTVDPCIGITTLALGATASGSLITSDCKLSDGRFIDFFATTVPTAGTYLFTQSSTSFDTFLALFSGTGNFLAAQDDISPSSTNSALKAILPAGNVQVGATSFEPNVTGNYTVSSVASPTGITNCEEVYVTRGISTAQELQNTDCRPTESATSAWWDDYFIFLEAGQSITVTMSSGTIDCLVEVYSPSPVAVTRRVAFKECSANSATMTFTSTSTQVHVLRATSVGTGVTGSYTLVVQ
jgi:hypothetical protein